MFNNIEGGKRGKRGKGGKRGNRGKGGKGGREGSRESGREEGWRGAKNIVLLNANCHCNGFNIQSVLNKTLSLNDI